MQRSEIDRRAKRYAPRQCLSDVGMHKDAPPAAVKPVRKTKTRRFRPLKMLLRNAHTHDGLWTCTDPNCEDWK